MIDKFSESLYKIKEAYNGHYSVKIQMDSDLDILNLIDDSYKYVWIIGHSEYLNEWTPSKNTLFSRESDPNKVSVRKDKIEILMDTDYFCEILREGEIREYLHIIQTNVKPPFFLDLNKFTGKSRYDMLKKYINYLFEIKQMADCEEITSSSKDVLEKLLLKLDKPLNKTVKGVNNLMNYNTADF